MLQTYTHCHQKFEEQCLKNPSSMALATSHGTMSYAELNRFQHQVALYKERQMICEHQADENLISDIAQSQLFSEAQYHHRFEQTAANVTPQIANLVQTHRAFGQRPANQPTAPQVAQPANPPPQQVEAANLLFGLLAAFQQAAQQQGSEQQENKSGGPGKNK